MIFYKATLYGVSCVLFYSISAKKKIKFLIFIEKNGMSDKGLISEIYKEHIKFIINKTNNLNKK